MANGISYIDGIGGARVVNGLAHLDFVCVLPPAKDGGPAQVQVSHRMVMGLPQFVRMCAEMASHLRQMEQQGLIKRTENNGA